MYGIIPDIHGDFERLTATLTALGFGAELAGGQQLFTHPHGRKAVFLGDLINGGSSNARVLSLVRAMQQAGHAHVIMGNHELNALLFHTPHPSKPNRWLRKRNADNKRQHARFMAEYAANADDDVAPVRDGALRDVLNWFQTLPLFLDFGALRVVHAQWDPTAIGILAQKRGLTTRHGFAAAVLQPEDLPEIAAVSTAFGALVERTLKGMEIALPENVTVADMHGNPRSSMRVRWWAKDPLTYRSAALSVSRDDDLPDTAIATDARITRYLAPNPPVFMGHYKMRGTPHVNPGEVALCLDYPQAPCAYVWQHEDTGIMASRLVMV